jgi:hypothetical protein
MRAGLDALAAEVGDAPPFDPHAQLPPDHRSVWLPIAAVVILVAALAGGVAAWSTRGDDSSQISAGPIGGSTTPSTSEPSSFDADRVDVGDRSGQVVGSFSNAEAEAARRRVRDRLLELIGDDRELPEDQVNRLADALEVLDPVAVTDRHGVQVGYLIDRFVPTDRYEDMRVNAQRVVDEFDN